MTRISIVIDSHTETLPSLRIDKAFPALEAHALALEFENMDLTDHSHVPYVVILVRALHEWREKVRLFDFSSPTNLRLILCIARRQRA